MDLERKTLRTGAVAVVFAIGLRLLTGGLPERLLSFLTRPETAAFVLYMETGRVLRPGEVSVEETVPPETEAVTTPPETTLPPPAQPPQAAFSRDDAAAVEVANACGYQVDVPAMLTQTLDWELPGPEPTVLILHSHGSECFSDGGEDYRSLDNGENVVSLGTELAARLEEAGIRVLHDRTLHDQPSYDSAYTSSREAAKEYLARYPSLRLVLDIHRDAAEDQYGQQLAKTVTVDGQQVAQLMLVVGTDAGGLTHPDWEENMALAVKLHAQLEAICPGICRPISFRRQRFNQDLSPGALIVEVGAAGNTHQQALAAVEYLSLAVQALSYGAVTAGSTS